MHTNHRIELQPHVFVLDFFFFQLQRSGSEHLWRVLNSPVLIMPFRPLKITGYRIFKVNDNNYSPFFTTGMRRTRTDVSDMSKSTTFKQE